MMLASCSNSDEPATSGQTSKRNPGDESFVAVRIMAANGTSFGRGEAGGFEDADASTKESEIKDALFLFFDAYGNSTQSPQRATLSFPENSGKDSPAVEKISDATVVIVGNTAPTQMLCILNPRDAFLNNVSGKSLSAVLDQINNYTTDETRPLFVMSNSTYVDDRGNVVCATPIDVETQSFPTKEEAEAATGEHIVSVYVERILAKVTTTALPSDFAKGASFKLKGTEGTKDVTLIQEITGIEVANDARLSYLFKKVDPTWSWDLSGWTGPKNWSDPANRRSYWAVMPSTGFVNQSWNAINATSPTTAHTFYASENTSSNKASVLITATLKENLSDTEGFTFVYWAGNYYDQEQMLLQYAAQVYNEGYRIKRWNPTLGADELLSIDPTSRADNFRFMTKEEHDPLVGINQGAEESKFKDYETTAICSYVLDTTSDRLHPEVIVKLKNDPKATESYDVMDNGVEAINAFLRQKKNRCWIWNGGRCYYFAEIEHFGPKIPSTDLNPVGIDFSTGVVRNHYYQIDLKSVQGLGTPVYNPDHEIIPEKPADELYYIAAQVNVLKWKIVKQEVNFKGI